ncbi:MAG: hypothetical protein HQ494_14020 [Rhodospirillales bacterium]|nr:hypothetical protein [Rhodospirillales bacterium]
MLSKSSQINWRRWNSVAFFLVFSLLGTIGAAGFSVALADSHSPDANLQKLSNVSAYGTT